MHSGHDRCPNCRSAVKMSAIADGVRGTQDPMRHASWHNPRRMNRQSLIPAFKIIFTAYHPFADALPRNESLPHHLHH